ncbi:hypothetical protein BDV93DRAFT_527641, partial [Ceratobasidium sp. AG-I]
YYPGGLRFFDLVVIGAGPAALALVARILDDRVVTSFSQNQAKGAASCHCEGQMRVLVIDKMGGGWMENWNRQFSAFEIKHLRSPLFFQPAPADLDALLAFADREGRSSSGPPPLLHDPVNRANPQPELIEIPGCVGAGISKHKRTSRRSRKQASYARLVQNNGPAVNERDRRDYFTPGTSLFHDFVQRDVIKRYGLDSSDPWRGADSVLGCMRDKSVEAKPVTMLKGEVISLDWTSLHIEGLERTEGFCLDTSDGARIGAKAVVCAVGMGGCPSVPLALLSSPGEVATSGPGWAHSSCLANPLFIFPSHCQGGTLVVIGGGLTSAQICDLALRKGFSNVNIIHSVLGVFPDVILILRGHMKVKPFDVSLDWMGRYANLKKMEFWQETNPLRRLEMLREARNGGSVTPIYAKVLKMHEAGDRLRVCTMTNIERASWNTDDNRWSLGIRATSSPTQDLIIGSALTTELENISADFIVAATGTIPSFSSLPFIQSLYKNPTIAPCPTVGGLPLLDSHLQWPDLPLFCVGGYSALQAADRVVERLGELALGGLGESVETKEAEGHESGQAYTYFDFNLLAVEG